MAVLSKTSKSELRSAGWKRLDKALGKLSTFQLGCENCRCFHLIYRARFSPIITPTREQGEAEMQTRRVPDIVHAAEHTEKHVTLIYSRGPGRGPSAECSEQFFRTRRAGREETSTDRSEISNEKTKERRKTLRVHLLHIRWGTFIVREAAKKRNEAGERRIKEPSTIVGRAREERNRFRRASRKIIMIRLGGSFRGPRKERQSLSDLNDAVI
jgi:hypothetical protein